ncbi:GNAT family N-acetyltransferase [Streptomyces sp. S6]
MRHFLTTDPEVCWTAEKGNEIVGFAISRNRTNLWSLATYGVHPAHQRKGTENRRLMASPHPRCRPPRHLLLQRPPGSNETLPPARLPPAPPNTHDRHVNTLNPPRSQGIWQANGADLDPADIPAVTVGEVLGLGELVLFLSPGHAVRVVVVGLLDGDAAGVVGLRDLGDSPASQSPGTGRIRTSHEFADIITTPSAQEPIPLICNARFACPNVHTRG